MAKKRGPSERKIRDAQLAADLLERLGYRKEAGDVRSLCRSNAALKLVASGHFMDNQRLRDRLAQAELERAAGSD